MVVYGAAHEVHLAEYFKAFAGQGTQYPWGLRVSTIAFVNFQIQLIIQHKIPMAHQLIMINLRGRGGGC